MTDKIKKWLIRRSENRERIEKITKFFAKSSVILLLLVIILSVIGEFIVSSIIIDGICTIVFLILIMSMVAYAVLDLIETFLSAINRNKEIILSNYMIFILLSDESFVIDFGMYLICIPIIVFIENFFYNIGFNLLVVAILSIISFILIEVLVIILSEKISNYFKKKLS